MSAEYSGPGYDDKTGMNKAIPQPNVKMANPLKLRFKIDTGALAMLETATSRVKNLIADLDLRVVRHDAYSKGLMKKYGLSPDGFIQMALQLAYYRDSNGTPFSFVLQISDTFLQISDIFL